MNKDMVAGPAQVIAGEVSGSTRAASAQDLEDAEEQQFSDCFARLAVNRHVLWRTDPRDDAPRYILSRKTSRGFRTLPLRTIESVRYVTQWLEGHA